MSAYFRKLFAGAAADSINVCITPLAEMGVVQKLRICTCA